MCSQCKTEKVEYPVVICMSCKFTHSRVLWCTDRMDGRHKAAWDNTGKAKKEAFMRSAKGLRVPQMKKYLLQFIRDQCYGRLLYVFCKTALAAPTLRQIAEYLI